MEWFGIALLIASFVLLAIVVRMWFNEVVRRYWVIYLYALAKNNAIQTKF